MICECPAVISTGVLLLNQIAAIFAERGNVVGFLLRTGDDFTFSMAIGEYCVNILIVQVIIIKSTGLLSTDKTNSRSI
jgi:hypothetical protein